MTQLLTRSLIVRDAEHHERPPVPLGSTPADVEAALDSYRRKGWQVRPMAAVLEGWWLTRDGVKLMALVSS